MEKKPQVRVGVAVFIIKDSKILLGKRKNAHGHGTWSVPGGHLEYNEDMYSCVVREVKEETGVTIKNIKQCTFTNDIFEKEGKHYVTLYFTAEIASGEPQVMEPEKCESWEWFAWDALPQPLFIPLQNIVLQEFNPLR